MKDLSTTFDSNVRNPIYGCISQPIAIREALRGFPRKILQRTLISGRILLDVNRKFCPILYMEKFAVIFRLRITRPFRFKIAIDLEADGTE